MNKVIKLTASVVEKSYILDCHKRSDEMRGFVYGVLFFRYKGIIRHFARSKISGFQSFKAKII